MTIILKNFDQILFDYCLLATSTGVGSLNLGLARKMYTNQESYMPRKGPIFSPESCIFWLLWTVLFLLCYGQLMPNVCKHLELIPSTTSRIWNLTSILWFISNTIPITFLAILSFFFTKLKESFSCCFCNTKLFF